MFGAPLQEGFSSLNPQYLDGQKEKAWDERLKMMGGMPVAGTEMQVAGKERQGYVANMPASASASCMYTAQGHLQCGPAGAAAAQKK